MSKRDSVPVDCADFLELLLYPDRFKRKFSVVKSAMAAGADQLGFWIPGSQDRAGTSDVDVSLYNDLNEDE
jgi:hypothetical protein